ncbi:hypothetical protein PUN28_000928 [Cardiocondyla obscurior]|uniref:Uncharacterized protein n=1 Tax=Cardiocondyla obscurior TaxID=286306 RepID=A0AAW2H1V4_9HYME
MHSCFFATVSAEAARPILMNASFFNTNRQLRGTDCLTKFLSVHKKKKKKKKKVFSHKFPTITDIKLPRNICKTCIIKIQKLLREQHAILYLSQLITCVKYFFFFFYGVFVK